MARKFKDDGTRWAWFAAQANEAAAGMKLPRVEILKTPPLL